MLLSYSSLYDTPFYDSPSLFQHELCAHCVHMSTTHREGASRGHGMKPWAKRVLVQIAEFHLNRRRVMPKHSFSDLHFRQEEKSGSATCSTLSADKKLQALKVCLSEVMCVFAPPKKSWNSSKAARHVASSCKRAWA